jgi:hypothetical protein
MKAGRIKGVVLKRVGKCLYNGHCMFQYQGNERLLCSCIAFCSSKKWVSLRPHESFRKHKKHVAEFKQLG